MKPKIQPLFSVATLFLLLFVFSNCSNKNSDYIDPRGVTYAGAESCLECHPKIYYEAIKSTHFKASAAATDKSVLGHFNQAKAIYTYDKDTKMIMENRKNGFFQVHYKNRKEVQAYRFDIVMGAKNAQTSLFWEKNNLYELPLSYYVWAKSWGTSPSYPSHQPYFDRVIPIDCFECHSSNLELNHKNTDSEDYFGTTVSAETFKKESLVFGIDCERCHGPAKDHVDYHQKNPDTKLAKHIVSLKSLHRNQKLVGCVICHSAAQNRQSRFQLRPGHTLSDFYTEFDLKANSDPEVHGNQFGLLSQSKCYTESKTMDCTSCHNSHNSETQSLSKQSENCMNCHSIVQNNFCTIQVPKGTALKDNCIDCHMPKKASTAIGFYLSGKSELSPYLLRTHRIGIYAEESKKKTQKKIKQKKLQTHEN